MNSVDEPETATAEETVEVKPGTRRNSQKDRLRAEVHKIALELLGSKKSPDALRVRVFEASQRLLADEDLLAKYRADIKALKDENAQLKAQLAAVPKKKSEVNSKNWVGVLKNGGPDDVPVVAPEVARKRETDQKEGLRKLLEKFQLSIGEVQRVLAMDILTRELLSPRLSDCHTHLFNANAFTLSPDLDAIITEFKTVLKNITPQFVCSEINPLTDQWRTDYGGALERNKKGFSEQLSKLVERLGNEIAKF